jgi:hypothetical protein
MSSKLLPKNEHIVERVARVAVGAFLVSLVFVGPQTPWGWVGLVPIATGLMGSCPAYTLFGLSTSRAGGKSSSPKEA